MDSIWIKKAKKAKDSGEMVWDGKEYVDSDYITIEDLAEIIREESLWECMSEMAEED